MRKGNHDQPGIQVAGRQLRPQVQVETAEMLKQGLSLPGDENLGPAIAGDGGVQVRGGGEPLAKGYQSALGRRVWRRLIRRCLVCLAHGPV